MICYKDEILIDKVDSSQEEIKARIRELEIKNFGHEIDFSKLPKKDKEPTIFIDRESGNIPLSEYNEQKNV